jgi:hypothetical protein
LRVIAVSAAAPAAGAGSVTPVGFSEDPSTGFVGLAVFKDAGESVLLFGRVENSPRLTAAGMEYLPAGHTLLSCQSSPDALTRIFMSRLLDLENPTRGVLVGEISSAFMWDISEEDSLPYLTKLCVLDQSSAPIFCSPDFPPGFHAQAVKRIAAFAVGQLE